MLKNVGDMVIKGYIGNEFTVVKTGRFVWVGEGSAAEYLQPAFASKRKTHSYS